MNYKLGAIYHYPGSKEKFKLIEVDRWIFIFECGHRVTECIFEDMFTNDLQIEIPFT